MKRRHHLTSDKMCLGRTSFTNTHNRSIQVLVTAAINLAARYTCLRWFSKPVVGTRSSGLSKRAIPRRSTGFLCPWLDPVFGDLTSDKYFVGSRLDWTAVCQIARREARSLSKQWCVEMVPGFPGAVKQFLSILCGILIDYGSPSNGRAFVMILIYLRCQGPAAPGPAVQSMLWRILSVGHSVCKSEVGSPRAVAGSGGRW